MIIINLTGEKTDRHQFLSYLRNSLEQKNFKRVKDENSLENNSFYYKINNNFIIEKIIFQHDNKKYSCSLNFQLSKDKHSLSELDTAVEDNAVQNIYVCRVRSFNAELATNSDIIYVDDKKCCEGLNLILGTTLFTEAAVVRNSAKGKSASYQNVQLYHSGIFSLQNSPQANLHDKGILVKSSP